MKDIFFVFALLVAVCASVILFRFNQEKSKVEQHLQEERYSRLVAEETSQKNVLKIKQLETDLKSAQDKFWKIEKILDQEKNVNAALKEQFEKITTAKSELEAKLKSTLDGQTSLTVNAQQERPMGVGTAQ